MNIKNIIAKIFSLTLIFGVMFFGMSSVFAACSNDMSTGSASQPGNAQSSGSCRSYATTGTDRYNNQEPLEENDNTAIFLKMIGKSRIPCNASNVAAIQSEMQRVGDACSTCIDGKAGESTRLKIKNNCLAEACSSPLYTPILVDNQLVCENGELNGNKCCIANEEATCTTYINAPNTYTGIEEPIAVTVDFDLSFTDTQTYTENGSFTIDGGTLSATNCTQSYDGDIMCDFDVFPIEGESSITITSPTGKITYTGNIQCPEASKTINRDDDIGGSCANTNTEKPLDGSGTCDSYIGDGWTTNDDDCCVLCDKPPVTASGHTCEENYGTGWSQGTGGCCEFDCPKDPTDPNHPGEILDKESCERVCDPNTACCGIQLNTVVPFIGDCIEMTTQNKTNGANGNTSYVNQLNAFPFLMMGLSKILVTVILIFSFLVVIAAGLMMVTGVYEEGNYKKGMDRIRKVIIALILLGSSGLILKLINPSFFGG